MRNPVSVKLGTDACTLRKRVAKPNFCRGNPITYYLTVVQCKVATLTLNRPIYVGFSVLELSKLQMYDFHYNHMCVKYHLRLLFTDTDSLAYAVQTDGIYKDMANDAASRYTLHGTANCKALGFFKDELNSVPMQEFVGICPKCYAFLCTGKVDKNILQHTKPVEKKTAKAVKRKVKDYHLHFAHYLDVLRSFKSYVCKQNLIYSTNHTDCTVHTRKVGLTAFETKGWLCEDTVHTHSHGHKDIVSDPMTLFGKSDIVKSFVNAGIFSHNDLPGTG